MRMILYPTLILACSLAFASILPAFNLAILRASDDTTLSTADLEFFEKQVRPLLVTHCFECHAGSEKNGNLRLDSRAAMHRGGDTGPALVAGAPDKSLMIEAIRYKNRDLQMPPKKQLSDAEVAVLVEWIQRGAPDPRKEEPAAAVAPLHGMSLEDGRNFWSFQPLTNPAVPEVQRADWIQSPIDAFILAKLEEHNLQPAPPADKRTLIRRATLDLIGLPPTEAEVDAFIADESPAAFDGVIDRLLESPQYGVRWGRHWLDVARYADSNGLDENLAFGTAWRFRDYVIDSFNRDKPFDRFVMEQVAGDLLRDQSTETHIATGYLVLGAKVLAEPDREKLTMDTIDEQIDTLGKTFMGMTFGCARCHDHKFDPISQADYYALAAIFKSTKTFGDSNTGAIKHWHEINLATPEDKERLKAVDAAIAEKQRVANSYKAAAMTKIRDQARAQAVDYLVLALKLDLDTSLTEVAAVAQPAGLHPRILHHCRRHLEFHADDPFFAKWQEIARQPAAQVVLANIERPVESTIESPIESPSVSSTAPPCGESEDEPKDKPEDEPKAAVQINADVHPIVAHYGPLFSAARQWAEDKQKDAKLPPHADPNVMAAHAALFDTSGFLTVPAKVGFAFDAATLTEYNRLADEARVLESFSPDMPSAMSVSENTTQATMPIHIRGSHRNLGEAIERGFPKVMQSSSAGPILPRHSSGRLELAEWLTSNTHPLTARVYVNRVWGWHFGQALVGSTENFGVLGDRPTHPELLDWLARSFIESGLSTKQLHRLIMRSSVYQQSSSHGAANQAIDQVADQAIDHDADPENRWLSKFRVQRLDAEQIRDCVLAVSGRLDQTLGGKSVPLRNRQFVFDHTSIDHTRYDSLRRAVYLPVIRNNVYTLFEQFDFPDPTMPTGHRHTTTVAPQALLLMNSDLVMDSATSLADQLLTQSTDTAARSHALTQRLFGRQATADEIAAIEQFIVRAGAGAAVGAGAVVGAGAAVDQRRAWSLVCQSLMVSNEFFMVR